MELARLSSDEGVRRVVSLWDGLSTSDRRYVSLDDLCEAGGVRDDLLFGMVVGAVAVHGLYEEEAKRLRAAPEEHVRVVEEFMRRGQCDGWKYGDKRRFCRAVGLLI
jgi:hypothetical protein